MKHSFFFLLFICFVLSSCNRYYMPITSPSPSIDSIRNYIHEDRYLVLRTASAAYEMKKTKLEEGSNVLRCELLTIKGFRPTHGLLHIKNPYYEMSRPDSARLNQIHLHTDLRLAKDSVIHADVPMSAIYSVENLTYDRRKTTRHRLGAALGITACTTLAIILTASVVNEFKDWGN